MTSDLDDLLGHDDPTPAAPAAVPPPRAKRDLPRVPLNEAASLVRGAKATKAAAIVPDPDLENLPDGELPALDTFHRPVRATFLARVLNTEPGRILKMLSRCTVIEWHWHQGKQVPAYDFREALRYVVEPKVDIGAWIKKQTAATLPNHINKAFWEGQAAKLRVMEKARELWHNEDVLDVLGRTAMTIKEETQLWVENLPGKSDMTTEQYNALQRFVTELQDSIHERLVTMPKEFQSRPYAATIESELEDTNIGEGE